jgi:hypothetical protein
MYDDTRLQSRSRKTGAPGETRTPDQQLRSVNQDDFNTVTRLAFLQLSESPFGVLSVSLPSCSHLTYSANTQQVIQGCGERGGFLQSPASSLPGWIDFLRSDVSSGFRAATTNTVICNGSAMKNQPRSDLGLWYFRGRGSGSPACSSGHLENVQISAGTKGRDGRAPFLGGLGVRRQVLLQDPLQDLPASLDTPQSTCCVIRARTQRRSLSYRICSQTNGTRKRVGGCNPMKMKEINWCARRDSNSRPTAPEAAALSS